jgi:hypothetical protein
MRVRNILIGLYPALVLAAIALMFVDDRDPFLAVWALLLTVPWSQLLIQLVPTSWSGPFILFGIIGIGAALNTIILWYLCGGAKDAKKKRQSGHPF